MINTSKSILVVDDSKAVRKFLALHLQRAGYEVDFAVNGMEALRMLRSDTFDLLLLDVMMPGMSGLEVLEIIRKRYTIDELPVIIVSGRHESENIVEALSSGANDYVVKPIDPQITLARVATHLSVKKLSEVQREFLGIASHDLKKPLLVMIDIIETLESEFQEGDPVTEELLEDFGLILKTGEYMQHILQDYLDLYAVESGNLKLTTRQWDLNKIALKVIGYNGNYARSKKHSLHLELNDEPLLIHADEIRIIQIMDNLVGNAIKFSPLGGTTIIRTRPEGNDFARFEVQDNGPGLSAKEMELAFVQKVSNFSNRPTGKEKSTGLGLSICKQLISLHRGEIGLHANAPDPGTTFWFQLPVWEDGQGNEDAN